MDERRMIFRFEDKLFNIQSDFSMNICLHRDGSYSVQLNKLNNRLDTILILYESNELEAVEKVYKSIEELLAKKQCFIDMEELGVR